MSSKLDLESEEEEEEFWNELGRALQGYLPLASDAFSTSDGEEDEEDEEGHSKLGDEHRAKRTRLLPQPPPTSSSYRGVSLCSKDSRWQARIRIKKEVVYLGRFETQELAARRYDEAAREHHGSKALINFITQLDRDQGRKSAFEQPGGKSSRN
ncbi:hypothetical protein BASA81_007562 [Batrachochytrium salamandrivorans]|nr:hypothetical protein BASA81_007562 [Batrachochytrium salamandrivorans]